jgi:hypothetical protein
MFGETFNNAETDKVLFPIIPKILISSLLKAKEK